MYVNGGVGVGGCHTTRTPVSDALGQVHYTTKSGAENELVHFVHSV